MEPTPRLSYAARAPWSASLNRRNIRLGIALALVALLALIGPACVAILGSSYWESKAAAYLPPAGQVAMTHTASDGLFTTPPLPTCWRHLGLGEARQGLILLHRLQCDGDQPALVAVSVSGGTSAMGSVGMMIITSVQSHHSHPLTFNTQWFPLEWASGASNVTIHVATLDPSDPSHFWFAGEADGVEHVMDGYLRDDQSVLITDRPTPQQSRPTVQ